MEVEVDARDGATARVLAGRYELRRRLGSGGSGLVWSGHDRALDRPVAIKLLRADLAEDPAAEARFRTEATAAARLTHPNAVLVHDLGREDEEHFLVMELVEGASLARVLGDGPLPSPLAAATCAMVARALGAAHGLGIVHRDVKPANVLLTADGVAKLADFGIARAFGNSSSRLTRAGTVLGTARYLAPEQLRDEPIDARADVYALGLVLHEALTGRPPFGEGHAAEVAARRLTTTLPSVRTLVDGVPAGLDEVVRWATRMEPDERPEDGMRLADALRHFVSLDATGELAGRVATARRHRGTATRLPPPPPAGERRAEWSTPPPPPAPSSPPTPPPSPAPPTPAPAAPATVAVAAGADRLRPDTDELLGGRTGTDAVDTPDLDGSDDHDGYDDYDDGGDGHTTDDVGRRPPSRGRWSLVVLGLVAIGVLIATTGDDRGSTPDPAVALAVTAVGDHDPEGDQAERSADVANVIDGDLATYWPTETYTSADFGGLPKSGVGLWLRVGPDAAIERVEVVLSIAGGSMQLWVGDGPPNATTSPGNWGRLVGDGPITATDMGFVDLPANLEGDTVLLWFTELPESSAGPGNRAEVREVRVLGR